MRRNIRGFTLLELMISIALMLIVMMMLRTMFSSAQSMYVIASRRVEVYSQARVAMDIIEQDVLRMRNGGSEDSLQLRSLSVDDLVDPEKPRKEFYSELRDFDIVDENESVKMKEFLSFIGNTTWYDKDTKQYESGDAKIFYYLKKRPPSTQDRELDGAYLVRRILPIRTNAELVKFGKEGWRNARDIKPFEEEIAAYVYSVRVLADDKVSFQWGVDNKTTYSVFQECNEKTRWLWTPTGENPPPPAQTERVEGKVISLAAPPQTECSKFSGEYTTMTAPTRRHIMSVAEYPNVIVLEITLIDRYFSRNEGSGSYRTLTRAIFLPWAVPSRVFDQRDIELIKEYGVGK
ncbi:MAG: prepilin-type N-terminal cleavage/methylation domain-containing protein [Planctomycetes bacterium]|nr:prepilin-type N-terminal cleavage/methylation domain-containing protein [Planctomycetota bacterium]